MTEPHRAAAAHGRHLHAVDQPPAARLATPRGEELPVEVRDRGDELLLVLLVEPPPDLGDELDDAVFESGSPQGLLRVHGHAHRVDVDLLRFEADGQPEVVQRREYFRVAAAERVGLDAPEGTKHVTRSLNLSGGGMLLAGPDSLELGAIVEFWIVLGEQEGYRITGIGRVVRATDDGRRAITFEQIAPADRERLVRFVFDRQRLARARTRGDLL